MEYIGLVSACIDLIKFGRSCIYLFREAGDAIPENQQNFLFRLMGEQSTFQQWCDVLGLLDVINVAESHGDSYTETPEFAIFRDRAASILRLDEDRQQIVLQALISMESKFRKALPKAMVTDNTKAKQPLASDGASTSDAVPTQLKSSRLSRFLGKGHREARAQGEKPAADRSSMSLQKIINGAKWLAWDQREVELLLKDIRNINDTLTRMVPLEFKHHVIRQVQVAQTHHLRQQRESKHLDDSTSPEATASQARVPLLDQMSHDDETESHVDNSVRITAPRQKPHIYRPGDFQVDIGTLGLERTIIQLGDQPVLLDWKYYSSNHPLDMELILRLGYLLELLRTNDTFRDFRTLCCRGALDDKQNSRIGLMFDMSTSINLQQPLSTTCRSLQDYIRDHRSKGREPPTPGHRVHVARQLAMGLHQIMSVGWFHRSFRSDNVVYFDDHATQSPPEGSGSSALAGPPPLPVFYILGWDLARPNGPTEVSESLSMSSLGYEERRRNIELYSHPDMVAVPQTAESGTDHASQRQPLTPQARQGLAMLISVRRSCPRFRTAYDIYGLGLVMLELGLWKTIKSLRRAGQSKAEFHQDLVTVHCDRLLARMGEVYWRVTKRCLTNNFDIDPKEQEHEDGVDTSHEKLQAAFSLHVLCELEKLFY